jgi:4-amino-4-deoxy-L-arabinose transferase-like glycosyltransferase
MAARKQRSRSPKPVPGAPSQASAAKATSKLRAARWWPLAIVAVALAVRIVYFLQFATSPLVVSLGPDDSYYLDWAKRIAAGDWLGSEVFEQGPLYPYLLGLLFALLGEVSGLVYLLQLLSGVLLCLLIYDAAERLFNSSTAAVAGLLAALYGPFVFYECMVMKSFLSPLLTALVLWSAVRYRQDRQLRWLWLAGAAVGLASLVQENHILLLGPLAVWAWQFSRGTCEASRSLVRVAIPLLAAALCIAPVTLRNWIVGRELVLVTAGGGEVFYMAHGPAARPFYNPPDFVVAAPGEEHEDFRREALRRTGQELSRGEASRYWFGQGVREIFADLPRSLKLTVQKAAVLLGDYDVPDSQSYAATRVFVPLLKLLPSFGCVGGLALVGAALSLQTWRQHWLPASMVAVFAVSILLTYNFGRMRLGMMPAVIVQAGYAVVWIAGAMGDPRRRIVGAAAAAAAIGLSAAMFYPLLAGDFELSDRKSIAGLAMLGGRYDLAEEHLLAIERALKSIPAAESASGQYLLQVAQVHQMLGQLYSRTGRIEQAAEQFRQVRLLPLRNEYRESMLLQNAGIMQQLDMSVETSEPKRPLTVELAHTAEQLRRMSPDRVEYWALSAVYRQAGVDSATLAAGLDEAYQSLSSPSPQQQGYYWLGRAALSAAGGDGSAAAGAATRASQHWPQNPFQPLLEKWQRP